MSLLSLITRSVRPTAEAVILGVGKGSGTNLDSLFKLGAAAAHAVDIRARADATAGVGSRVLYARLHQYGAGEGEAVRAYAFANNAATATGGTLNGLHASMSIATSCGISGAGQAIRATLEAAAATRTLGGTLAALNVDTNIGANNTLGATAAFIRVTDTGAVRCNSLLNIPAAANGTLFAAHTTQAMTHSIKFVNAAGTAFYIMCTDAATNRS